MNIPLALNNQDNKKYILSFCKGSELIKFLCPQCNNLFETTKSNICGKFFTHNQAQIFCSKKCSTDNKIKKTETQCNYCKKIFFKLPNQITKSKNNFCSHSCSAKYNNPILFTKDKKQCDICNKNFLSNNNHKSLCYKCSRVQTFDLELKNWIENTICFDGVILPPRIREYLIKINNYQCCQCGWKKINIVTGKCPLTVHHKNGDAHDNRYDNLQILCPNCHSLTETYGRLNKKSSRIKRHKQV